MENINLEFTEREALSHGQLRTHRLNGDVPGIVYGATSNKKEKDLNRKIFISAKDLRKKMEDEGFYTQIITLVGADKKEERVVLRDIQRHVWKNLVQHIDFMRVNDDKKIFVKIPFHFINKEKCEGVKAGGAISIVMNEIEITCFPKNIPRFIEVDTAHLQIGDSLHISKLELPANVELAQKIVDDTFDHPIISVAVRKEIEEEKPVAEEAATADTDEKAASDEKGSEAEAKKSDSPADDSKK